MIAHGHAGAHTTPIQQAARAADLFRHVEGGRECFELLELCSPQYELSPASARSAPTLVARDGHASWQVRGVARRWDSPAVINLDHHHRPDEHHAGDGHKQSQQNEESLRRDT